MPIWVRVFCIAMSSHPKSVEVPDGIELQEFGDREEDDGIVEYVTFTASFDAGDAAVNEFIEFLQEEFTSWDVSTGGGVDEVVISMRKVYSGPVPHPEDSEEVEEYREREGEYYREKFEQSRDS